MTEAYLIARVEVTDPEAYKGYLARTPAAVTGHGGRFIVRGGPVTVMEGPPELRRIVVIEFPSRAALEAFWNSDAYHAARLFREGAAVFEAIAVDGVEG